MAKLCMMCLESYDESIELLMVNEDADGTLYRQCPKRACQGSIIDVDDLMLSTIIILNEKGYFTKSCCSGHLEEMITESYIEFETKEPILEIIPQGYELNIVTKTNEKEEKISENLVLSKKMAMLEGIGGYRDLLENSLNLHNWAEMLPILDMSEEEEDEIIKEAEELEKILKEKEPIKEEKKKTKRKLDMKSKVIDLKK